MNPRVGQFFMTQRGQFRMAFDTGPLLGCRAATLEVPRENRCSCLQKTLWSPLVAVWAARYPVADGPTSDS
jgi:hypothetical protein